MSDKSTLDPQRVSNPLDSPEQGDKSASDAIHQLLHARSVAVIGASGTAGKLGYRLFNYLQRYNFGGTLRPVNAKEAEIGGLRCCPSIARSLAPRGMAYLTENHLPVYLQPEKAVVAMRAMVDYARFQARRRESAHE